MADADDAKKQEDSKDESNDKKDESSNKKASGGGILQWIILAVVVVLFTGAGFGLSRLLAGFRAPAREAEPTQQDKPSQQKSLKAGIPDLSGGDSQKTWYYNLEPVVANLDEPGVTRYVRAAIILEISAEVDQEKGGAFLEEKKPVLANWLTIYLAGLTLEDIRGDRNLKRIQLQILDTFNEKLFPDAKPQIKHVFFKEFAIQ